MTTNDQTRIIEIAWGRDLTKDEAQQLSHASPELVDKIYREMDTEFAKWLSTWKRIERL